MRRFSDDNLHTIGLNLKASLTTDAPPPTGCPLMNGAMTVAIILHPDAWRCPAWRNVAAMPKAPDTTALEAQFEVLKAMTMMLTCLRVSIPRDRRRTRSSRNSSTST